MGSVLSLFPPEDRASAAFASKRGLDRLASFSDAVVAFAITLIMFR